MAISNFFFSFFPLTGSLNTQHTFKVQKTDPKLEKKGANHTTKKKKKNSCESIKEDMALLAWCGSVNRNVWSEEKSGIYFCPVCHGKDSTRAWLVLIYGSIWPWYCQCTEQVSGFDCLFFFLAST